MQFNSTNILENIDSYSIIVSDLTGLITYFNKGAEKIFGYSSEEMMGQTPAILYPDVDMAALGDDLAKIMQGIDYVGIWEGKRKNGETVILDIKTSLLKENGEPKGFIGFAKDITVEERNKKLIFAQQKKIKKELEDKVKFKSDFIAQMSHEIRTPLNGLMGMLDVLELTTNLSEKQKELLGVMNSSSKDLLKIVNDILDLSKLEAGKLSLVNSINALEPVISQTKNMYLPLAKKKGLDIIVESKNIYPELFFDKTRLGQVLNNLVSNAVKFTDKGKITIGCNLISESEEAYIYQFFVQDTGAGISEEGKARLFEKYSQLENADEKIKEGSEYGTGLGLNISQFIVKLMGGEIKVNSEIGKGSQFIFEVPISKPSALKKVNETEAIELPEGLSILLVDDKTVNQKVASMMLMSLKAKVSVCSNGQEAVDQLKNNKYDIILMDIQMPIMNGIEATKIIRNELKLTTPIIALTANAMEEDKVLYKNAGMDGHLSKPISINSIKKSLIKYV